MTTRAALLRVADLKPGDDLSYYLGPDAKCATADQCAELAETFRRASADTGDAGMKDWDAIGLSALNKLCGRDDGELSDDEAEFLRRQKHL